VWTTSRKIAGNLIPLLIASPLAGMGAFQLKRHWPFLGYGLIWLVVAVIAMWLAVNYLGLFKNESMKRAMKRRLEASLGPKEIPLDPMFVGFARPSYRGMLDPHEDVGFLLLYSNCVEFFGDKDRITLKKSALQRVRLRPNPHSWAFLGGWVSLEGVLEGKPVRMLLEPREKSSLLANRRLRKTLKSRLEKWLLSA
jgi:hypothetical protein